MLRLRPRWGYFGRERRPSLPTPLDFDGGLITHPTEFNHADWEVYLYTLTVDDIADPIGGLRAERFTETADEGYHGAQQVDIPKVASNIVYNSSCYFKAGTGVTYAIVHHQSGAAAGGRWQVFNLGSGTLEGSVGGFGSGATGGTGNITSVGNGWYRCELNGVTIDSGYTTMRLFLGLNQGSSYLGNVSTFGWVFGAKLVEA